jgi:hypothetical protein
MNLYQKIVEVRKIAEGFTKDGASYGYTYVTGNQVLGKIKDKMNELNLLLFPSTKMGEHHTHAYKTAKGKDALDFVVKGEMSYTWINGDEPLEREVVSWAYYGQQDDISKAFGSALTYSERYFLLKCLGLPTDEDDPDAKPEKQPYTPSKPTNQINQPNTPPVTQNGNTSKNGTSSGSITARVYKLREELKWEWSDLNKFAGQVLEREVKFLKNDIKTAEEWIEIEKGMIEVKAAS